MPAKSLQPRVSVFLFVGLAHSLSHAAASAPNASAPNASAPNASAPNASAPNASAPSSSAEARATVSRTLTRARGDRDAALLALEHLSPLLTQRKERVDRLADLSREFKRHTSAAAQAEKAQQAALKQKNHDAQAADSFALAVYHYDEAAKNAEVMLATNFELKKLENELISRVATLAALATRALATQKELTALLKVAPPADRSVLKAGVDELNTSVNVTKKASLDAQTRAALGSPESYAAQKPKRDAADAKLQADLDKAHADRVRVFTAVHANRAPGCSLHQVDFKNRDYEGMSQGGKPMPIRDGQLPDSAAETFGIPWVFTQVVFAHLSKDGAEQAIVGFSNQSADSPAGMSLVFDLGSECTVRYRGSVGAFLSSSCAGEHCYVSQPRRFLPGGGAEGCDAAEIGIANDKVVQRSLAKSPPGVCD